MLLEEEAVRKNADRYLQTLQKEYKAGIKSLDDELKRFYELYATENGVSAAQIRKPLSREEWLRYEEQVTELLKDSGMYQDRKARNRYLSGRISRLQALQNQAELELEKLGFNHNGTLTKHLHETYEDSYYHTVYNFGQVGITGRFDRLNPRKVEQICKVEWSGKSFSSRVWDNTAKLKREVKRLLSTGSICGTPVRVLSQRLAERMNVSYHRAETLVRTESAQISARATADGYEKSGVEKYRILATLDNRTSSICRSLDGKVFLLSEKVTGETYPPFHPNCRTTTVPEFDDFKINSTRAAKDKDNNRLEVPVGMKYPEWYQKYVLEEPEQKILFTPASNKQEAMAYLKNTLGFEKVQLTNTTLETINDISYALTEFYNEYPIVNGFIKELKSDAAMGDVVAAASAGYKKGDIVTCLKINSKYFKQQDELNKMIEEHTRLNLWSPKQGIYDIIKHELAHVAEASLYFKEAGIDPFESDPIKSLNEKIYRHQAIVAFGKGEIATEIVTQAFQNLGIPLTEENLKKEICEYAADGINEAFAECISENYNGTKRRVAQEVMKLFRERMNR